MSESNHNPASDREPDQSINRETAPAQSQPSRPDGAKAQDPLIGQSLTEDYLILDRLGAGGMAIVYKAKHLKTDRIVAVKTLRERDPAIMERFFREVQTLSKLKHKNIVEALDCVRTDAHHTFLVMEYLEGVTLESLIRSEGRVEKAEDIAALLTQICNALEHAHQQRIIHRDLKPANIVMMVDDSGITAKVLDFGIAKLQDDLQKLTSEGQALGSPLYMSPEQCMGHEITPASDVYSLGILAYQLITGELPYRSARMLEIMSAHCSPDIWPDSIMEARPDLPGVTQLHQIIFKALSTKIPDRFQSASEFEKAISFWIQSTRSGETKTAIKAQNAKVIQPLSLAQKDTQAIRDLGVRKTEKAKPQAGKFTMSDGKIAMLKLASFLVVAILLTSGLSLYLLNHRGAINTDGFMEASRFVCNLLSPAKAPESPTQGEQPVVQAEPKEETFSNGKIKL
jgi:eukaryotic-like serine/threonine-protein kinase